MPESTLVDTDVVYCTGDDVFTHVRNKTYGDLSGSTKPTQAQVDRLIYQMSEWADTQTGQAWRIRKVGGYEKRVKLSHKQKNSRHRRRRLRGTGRRENFGISPRGRVSLKHPHVKTIASAEGDKVEVLNPRSSDDITANEGRESGDFVVDQRSGVLKPDIQLFTAVGTQTHGPTVENPRVRVTYRYGTPYDTADHSGTPADFAFDDSNWSVSSTVPPDVRDAVALKVAARLISGDQYGELVPATGDDSPSLADAASSWKGEAEGLLKSYKRVR